jgi:hypothetical protein
LLGISTLDLKKNAYTNEKPSNITSNQDAPRRLLTHHLSSKAFFIDSRRLLQILATSFSPKTRAKMRKRREWERWEKFEHNNSRQRIDEK